MKPVSIIVKMRQSRKACTFITGYEPGGRRARRRAPKALCECHVWCVASPHLPPAFDRNAYVCHATSVARAGQAEHARGDGAGEADQGRDEHAHRARGAGAVDRELDVEEVIARGSVLIVCTILSLQLYCMNEGIPSMRLGRRERKRNVWGSETAGACATPVVDPTSATFDSYYITFLSLRNRMRWSQHCILRASKCDGTANWNVALQEKKRPNRHNGAREEHAHTTSLAEKMGHA